MVVDENIAQNSVVRFVNGELYFISKELLQKPVGQYVHLRSYIEQDTVYTISWIRRTAISDHSWEIWPGIFWIFQVVLLIFIMTNQYIQNTNNDIKDSGFVSENGLFLSKNSAFVFQTVQHAFVI